MLASAGIAVTVVPADVDEPALRGAMQASDPQIRPAAIAAELAHAKAEQVSSLYPAALVIGSDQVLSCEKQLHDKPADLDGAKASLLALRGRVHELCSSVALAESGRVVWADTDTARLTMREFSASFLDHYIAEAGDRICSSVGAYQLESLGIQLFERIEGNHFTILGMPLLALLAELRKRGLIAA